MSTQLATTLLELRGDHRERYFEKGLDVPDWVFASVDGEILRSATSDEFTRRLGTAGLRHIRIQGLRDRFASLLLSKANQSST